MTPKNALTIIALSLLTLTPDLRADAATHAAILKERDTVLSKIVADIEARNSLGATDDEAVWAAKIALYSFRRDAALMRSEKLQHQEQIVAVLEKKLSALKARSQMTDPLEVLRATDAMLAAKQLLNEVQSSNEKH